MIPIVLTFLSRIVGLVWNLADDYVEKKVRNGDIVDERVGEFFVSDLKKIKAKVNGMSEAHVSASLTFLRAGMASLEHSRRKSSRDQGVNNCSNGGIGKTARDSTDAAANVRNPILALKQEFEKLKRPEVLTTFNMAEKYFQSAEEEAIKAQADQSLSIECRIMACQLRVAAIIFRVGIAEPFLAYGSCVQVLRELHEMLAVQKMFFILLRKRWSVKSYVYKMERLENVMSVLLLNHFVFDFAVKYAYEDGEGYPDVFAWPVIELGKVNENDPFNPILEACLIPSKTSGNKKLVQELDQQVQRLCRVVVGKKMHASCHYTVNSRKEIILLDDDGNKITVIDSKRQSKDTFVFTDAAAQSNAVPLCSKGIAIDENDNIYVVRSLKPRDQNGTKEIVQLCVLDVNYKMVDFSLLDFLNQEMYRCVDIAVHKQNIIMISDSDNRAYVCDNKGLKGEYLFHFSRGGIDTHGLTITDDNNIMIPSADCSAIDVYITKGAMVSGTRINVPEGHRVWRVAFHHGLRKVIVLTYCEEKQSWFLLCYDDKSRKKELRWCEGDWDSRWEKGITSIPRGPVFVHFKESVTLI